MAPYHFPNGSLCMSVCVSKWFPLYVLSYVVVTLDQIITLSEHVKHLKHALIICFRSAIYATCCYADTCSHRLCTCVNSGKAVYVGLTIFHKKSNFLKL